MKKPLFAKTFAPGPPSRIAQRLDRLASLFKASLRPFPPFILGFHKCKLQPLVLRVHIHFGEWAISPPSVRSLVPHSFDDVPVELYATLDGEPVLIRGSDPSIPSPYPYKPEFIRDISRLCRHSTIGRLIRVDGTFKFRYFLDHVNFLDFDICDDLQIDIMDECLFEVALRRVSKIHRRVESLPKNPPILATPAPELIDERNPPHAERIDEVQLQDMTDCYVIEYPEVFTASTERFEE